MPLSSTSPVCEKAVKGNQRGIECSRCEKWSHAACCGVSREEYVRIGEVHVEDEHCYCPGCFAGELPFANVSLSCVDGEFDSGEGTDEHGVKGNLGKQSGLVQGDGGSAMFSHLNVRSLLPKYDEV